MAFRSLKLMSFLKNVNIVIRTNMFSSSVTVHHVDKINNLQQLRTEDNFVYLEDPDTFGTLSRTPPVYESKFEDEGDIQEHDKIENLPLPTQKLTIKQYSDIIKQYLKHKRLKEAIDVVETRMLKQDRVKPSNYIYNILIGACAEVGYTKKAFKLFNEMKRRALKATGDTYTCLFEACSNSPWPKDGLKNATHLRNLMIEKAIEPNLTNYNAMIKAFGRCGDLPTAFQIVDEMIEKKIKIRVHTCNQLLHACISDKESGLRHALIVWRKMLKLREKPNIYSFNLMLRCVKDCNLGSKEDIEELISILQSETPGAFVDQNRIEILQIADSPICLNSAYSESDTTEVNHNSHSETLDNSLTDSSDAMLNSYNATFSEQASKINLSTTESRKLLAISDAKGKALPAKNEKTISMQLVEKLPAKKGEQRTVPNLLSKKVIMNEVLSLQAVKTVQDKFAIMGGQNDFLKEMESYSVKPDVKSFTQMLMLVDDNIEAENSLMEAMKAHDIKADISFYNMLIKKRCLRSDYENARAVKEMIEKEDKKRKRKWPMKKKWRLKPNVMTYGVLAMACKTKENAVQLLDEMKEKQLKVNAQILGTLLRHGTAQNQFGYVVYIMKIVQEEKLPINDVFLKHLEAFNDKCSHFVKENKISQHKSAENFEEQYKRFSGFYTRWLNDINIEEVLKPEHPWQQFREDFPDPVQRLPYEIVEPKRFYKRDRRFRPYVAK